MPGELTLYWWQVIVLSPLVHANFMVFRVRKKILLNVKIYFF